MRLQIGIGEMPIRDLLVGVLQPPEDVLEQVDDEILDDGPDQGPGPEHHPANDHFLVLGRGRNFVLGEVYLPFLRPLVRDLARLERGDDRLFLILVLAAKRVRSFVIFVIVNVTVAARASEEPIFRVDEFERTLQELAFSFVELASFFRAVAIPFPEGIEDASGDVAEQDQNGVDRVPRDQGPDRHMADIRHDRDRRDDADDSPAGIFRSFEHEDQERFDDQEQPETERSQGKPGKFVHVPSMYMVRNRDVNEGI